MGAPLLLILSIISAPQTSARQGENAGGLVRSKAPGSFWLTLLGAASGAPAGGGVWRWVAGWQPARANAATNAANT